MSRILPFGLGGFSSRSSTPDPRKRGGKRDLPQRPGTVAPGSSRRGLQGTELRIRALYSLGYGSRQPIRIEYFVYPFNSHYFDPNQFRWCFLTKLPGMDPTYETISAVLHQTTFGPVRVAETYGENGTFLAGSFDWYRVFRPDRGAPTLVQVDANTLVPRVVARLSDTNPHPVLRHAPTASSPLWGSGWLTFSIDKIEHHKYADGRSYFALFIDKDEVRLEDAVGYIDLARSQELFMECRNLFSGTQSLPTSRVSDPEYRGPVPANTWLRDSNLGAMIFHWYDAIIHIDGTGGWKLKAFHELEESYSMPGT